MIDEVISTKENSFDPNAQGTDNLFKTKIYVWLLYEIIMFYGTIVGTLCFLIYAHIAKFRTLKEKAGHAGNERDQKDFLEYASKDAHWVIMNFQRFFLFSLVIQKHKTSG